MGNTLMILSHPDFDSSIGNKIISEFISSQPSTEIRHLDQLYPDFNINIKAEQEALLKADTIIFQYPLFWYSVPALMKEWIDQVFQYGFAFGSNSYHLEGKKIIVSFTMGSPSKDYPPEILDKILFPFRGLADYCRMIYGGDVVSNDINDYYEGAGEKAKLIAEEHAQKLIELIKH